MAIKFLIQLATDACKLKTMLQMQYIYFAAKKYLALLVYSDLYQFIDFYYKNFKVINLCDTPLALEFLLHLSKNLLLESNKYGFYLSEISAKDIEE
ncbi:772_t:CDS:1, partial [Dentiscutata heterogama]